MSSEHRLDHLHFGLSEYLIGETVEAAYEKHWGRALLGRELEAFDVVLLQADIVEAMLPTISKRREEYVARVAEDGAVSARKRRRAEVGELGGDAPVDDESNSPEHDNDDGKISEDVIAPDAGADANDTVTLSWGDEDVMAKPDDTIKAVDLKDEMPQEGETDIMKLKALVVGMT